MKFYIKHSIKGRLRVHMDVKRMTYKQADILEYYLKNVESVYEVKVYEKTCDVVISYTNDKKYIVRKLLDFSYDSVQVPDDVVSSSGREMNAYYQDRLVNKVFLRVASKMFLPIPFRNTITAIKSVKYIANGVKTLAKGKMEVPVLDATAIGVSILRNDFNTAGSVMFLLGIGEIMEEWTHKKSVGDLARTMSLNVSKVWLKTSDTEVLIPVNQVKNGDEIIVHVSNIIPFDGVVTSGEAMVNQASLTGESVPVAKRIGMSVFAGTVIEEGELTIKVKQNGGNSKYDKIVKMIEESEKLKSGLESKAEHLADSLVPYTLGGTALTYLLTRNVTKALSILMVDFSCALKLAMPITVLSAIRQAGQNDITVKGGKFLEAVADADTIVFDKTGTLTTGELSVNKVFAYGNHTSSEIIALAAACERYSSHPIAMAIKNKAEKENLPELSDYSEKAGQGVTAVYNGKALVCGGTKVLSDKQKVNAEKTASVYVIYDGELIGAISVSDTLRPEAKSVIAELRKLGVKDSVMLTGDKKENAMDIANELKLDSYSAELMPSDKLEKLIDIKKTHKSVCFIGDGINDAPVLTASDCGFAMGFGSEAAIEAADAVLAAGNLKQLPLSVRIAKKVVATVKTNITFALGVKTIVIILAILGIAPMWLSVIADTGVSVLCVLYAARLLHTFDKK